MTTKRILIAEDDVSVSRVLARIFARAGFDTLVANNGERALELVADHEVDVLITDINMPKLDGRELCRRLNDDGPYLPRVTIVVTSRMGNDERAWVDEIPGLELVEKPVSPKVLLKMVQDRIAHVAALERGGRAA